MWQAADNKRGIKVALKTAPRKLRSDLIALHIKKNYNYNMNLEILQSIQKSNTAILELIALNQQMIEKGCVALDQQKPSQKEETAPLRQGDYIIKLHPNGTFTCSCPHHKYRIGKPVPLDKACKHVKAWCKKGDKVDPPPTNTKKRWHGTNDYYDLEALPDGKFTCSCPHHKHRIGKPVPLGKACKHVKAWRKQVANE